MQKHVLIFIIGLFSFTVTAQLQLISSSSGYTSNEEGAVGWIIGETLIETYSTDDYMLTQGFFQTIIEVEIIQAIENLDFEISAFPNPTTALLILQVDKHEGLDYQLFNLEGKLIEQRKLLSNETEIDFGNLNASTYFIKVIDSINELKTFKIIKQ